MTLLDNISRALKHKNYRNYFFWQILSFTGTWIQTTAQSWLIYRLTGSPLFLGVVSFAASLPALVFSPLSGIVADNFKRKHVLLWTQILCLIQAILMIILFYSGAINKWHILYLSILLGVANSFDVTARQALIPLFVSKIDLLNAIALNSSMFNAARIIGPALAGILIALYGEGICFLLNAASYVPIIIFLFLVKEQKQEIRKLSSPYLHLKEGFMYAWSNLPIKSLLILVGMVSFWGMSFSTLMPVFSDKVLNSGAKGLGILMGCSGTGAVIGGLYLASRKDIIGIKKIIGFCSVLFSVCLFVFAFSRLFIFSMLLLGIIGFCFMIINAGSNTTMQSISPDYLRGRVIGLYSTMFMGMFPLGSLMVGCLANMFGVTYAVAICSCMCFISGLIFYCQVPKLEEESRIMFEMKKAEECKAQSV